MPGVFSKDARPDRPGAYFDWASLPVETIQPNIGSVVALGITHDWGPAETVTPCSSLADFQAKFGPSQTAGYTAVKQCFKGEGLPGRGGAGQVLVYRLNGTSGLAGTVTLNNTAGTPVPALKVTAKYPGTYGNQLGVRSRVNAAQPTYSDLLVVLAGNVVESYTYLATNIADLANQINAGSKWINAQSLVTGTALNTSTPNTVTLLATGNDGATLVASDWTDMITALSSARFSVFAPFDLIDPAIQTSLQVWNQLSNVTGRRFMLVLGGGVSDTAATAVARSATLAAASAGGGGENIINVGVGTLIDEELGTLTTSQLAPRVAGILAARGESMSITFARMQGCSAGVLPADSDVSTCFDGGVVVFGQDSNQDAPVRIEKGLTTYLGTDSTKPYLIYRNPKFMRTMHGIELELTDWAAANAIGNLQVNDATRAYVVGHAHEVIQGRADDGVIQAGFTVAIDAVPPPTDDDEFVALVYGIAFGRSVEQIFNTVYIS